MAPTAATSHTGSFTQADEFAGTGGPASRVRGLPGPPLAVGKTPRTPPAFAGAGILLNRLSYERFDENS